MSLGQRVRERRIALDITQQELADAKACSVSGVARCADCGGTMRVLRAHGRVRLVCTNRIKNKTCSQPSGYLDLYEQQLIEYLDSFHIPEDYQHRILEAHRKLQSAYDDVTKQKAALERRLQRAKELYEWGHKSKEEYWADYNMIQQQLQSLAPAKDQARGLERLALFLKDISEVWKQADEQQRNRLAKQLFDIVWIKDKKVLAVTPRPEFKPFFDLQYEGLSQGVLHIRPRGASKPLVILLLETYPVLAPFYLTIPSRPSRKLSPYLWPEIIARHKTESLRALAEEYGASRESVRRALVSAHQHCTASI